MTNEYFTLTFLPNTPKEIKNKVITEFKSLLKDITTESYKNTYYPMRSYLETQELLTYSLHNKLPNIWYTTLITSNNPTICSMIELTHAHTLKFIYEDLLNTQLYYPQFNTITYK